MADKDLEANEKVDIDELICSLPEEEALELIRLGYESCKNPFYRERANRPSSIMNTYLSIRSYEIIAPFELPEGYKIPEGYGPKKKQ